MINTELFKKTMARINVKVKEEKELLEANGVSTEGISENENIENLIRKTQDTSFKLLVMGRFSSGKSAFVNVLLGEKLLPEGALPMTALITEIYYGKEKKVVMFPKPGKWKGGNAPFEIEPTPSEIKKYCTIDNKGLNKKEANRIDSCFEKMVVFWPLDILQDGVSIIDSPGTDDPYANDYIVEEYVPKADAILYCISGTQAYCANDKNTLERINSIGFKNVPIVTTYFDVVTDGMSNAEIKDFIDTTYNSFYSKHSEKKSCHYVNSRLGIKAKLDNDHKSLVESGYFELEAFLGEYLTEYKGKEKIMSATETIKQYNIGQLNRINGVIANLDQPESDFTARINDAEKKLKQAELQGELLSREFGLEVKKASEEIHALAPKLYDGLLENLSLEGFEPDTSFSMWSPKQSSKQIAEECSNEIEKRNKKYVADWNEKTFMPSMTEKFTSITTKMQKQMDDFSADIEKANLSLNTKGEEVNTEVKTVTRVAMFAYALFTGDWISALMGGVFGAAAFGRGLICQFAGGFILGIVSLFTPVGLPALIITVLASTIVGIGWTASKAASTIKKKTVEKMREAIIADKDKIIAQVKEQCDKMFKNAQGKLKTAIDEDLAEVHKNIEIIQKEREENAAKTEERKAALSKVAEFVKAVNDEMDKIKTELKLK